MRLAVLILSLALAASPALAGPADQERARAAMEAGEIMPLSAILGKVDQKFTGRVLQVNLTDLDEGLNGWIYAITLLSPQDNVLVVKVDAGTGVILSVTGHGIEEARKNQ